LKKRCWCEKKPQSVAYAFVCDLRNCGRSRKGSEDAVESGEG
jgi:hypothetical protein